MQLRWGPGGSFIMQLRWGPGAPGRQGPRGGVNTHTPFMCNVNNGTLLFCVFGALKALGLSFIASPKKVNPKSKPRRAAMIRRGVEKTIALYGS